jgi:hypothetical protein
MCFLCMCFGLFLFSHRETIRSGFAELNADAFHGCEWSRNGIKTNFIIVGRIKLVFLWNESRSESSLYYSLMTYV